MPHRLAKMLGNPTPPLALTLNLAAWPSQLYIRCAPCAPEQERRMPMRPFYVRCASCAPEQEEARAAVTPDVLHVLWRMWATMAELQVGSPMWPMCSGAQEERARPLHLNTRGWAAGATCAMWLCSHGPHEKSKKIDVVHMAMRTWLTSEEPLRAMCTTRRSPRRSHGNRPFISQKRAISLLRCAPTRPMWYRAYQSAPSMLSFVKPYV